jgi:glycosyltransferase involved in cell wall biosynthesis
MPAVPRILQLVLSLNPGGTERLVIELARRLHARMPTAICCIDERGAWADGLEAAGIRVHELRRAPGFRPSIGLGVARVARAHRATVIHAHHYSPFVYGALARLARPGLRVIFTEHGRLSDAPPSSKRRFANRVVGMAASGVFAVSENVKSHLVGEGWPAAAVGVIYNGIDVGPLPEARERARVRAEIGASERTLVIGTIARLDPVKDLGTLVDAMAALPADPATIAVIVGDGSERTALEARVHRAGVSDRIRFLGQRDDARRWLAGCDVYVNCSVSEGVSLTILEAMAAGLPVVATRVGGTPEVVDDTCGMLIPARDAAALAAALTSLGRDPDRRATLGRAARARVEERFTIERMVSEYARVYAR